MIPNLYFLVWGRKFKTHLSERTVVPPHRDESAAGGDQAGLVGEDDGLDAVAQAQFREDAGDVGLHRRLAEEQRGGDLGVRHAAGDQAEDFEFAGGQRGRVAAGGAEARERAHDIGIFKALGMTPRQTLTMVICSVGITGLVAGIIAVPAGILLHHQVLPAMAHAANSGLPASLISIYSVPEMVILALAGLVIAIVGALVPASWAANSRTATALRTE